ncbi:MAG: alpha/beta hydrolase, partial [Azospirillaceae bacterium]
MATYVLVHGAWHTGDLMANTTAPIGGAGHTVHTPTLAGNRPGDSKRTTLDEAIDSLVDYIQENRISDAVLAGHSYGGMVITGAFDRLPAGTIRRLVYINAFVPNDGESLASMAPPPVAQLFNDIAADDGGVMLPWPIWRELFINDADEAEARRAYEQLNPQPLATFNDPIRLSRNPAAMEVGKSYINCTEDTAMPASLPWHPRLSEKLGLFRLVQFAGSH